ncbi:MAG TPA: hypothetical protein VK338_03425 [Candidatus Nitrosocosmicus sp.]|nr:hypothetical protein [Candidatus Nitrosocosmicus sp.]
MDKNIQKKIGRPSLKENQIDIIFRKIEPYLKSGLSIHKACTEAKIPKSTVYDLFNENDEFAEKVMVCKGHTSVLLNSLLFNELNRMKTKQKQKKQLDARELDLLKWYATHHNNTRWEFTEFILNEEEIRKQREDAARFDRIFEDDRAVTALANIFKIYAQKQYPHLVNDQNQKVI